MTNSPFVLSIETDAGTYQHGFHLGTDEALARRMVEDAWGDRKTVGLQPKIGTRIVTLALKRDGKIVDVFDGRWTSEYLDKAYLE